MKITRIQYQFRSMVNCENALNRVFLKCLPDDEELQTNSPDVEAKIIDGAAFVNMNMPRKSETLGEYSDELAEKINTYCRNTDRVDVVFDTYLPDSIISETRECAL